MNASEAANWFNHATREEQIVFLRSIKAYDVDGTDYYTIALPQNETGYFAEEKAREARTVIPEGRANRDPC